MVARPSICGANVTSLVARALTTLYIDRELTEIESQSALAAART
jgi:hypothetical protein